MSQSTKLAGGKARRSLKKDNANLFKDGFNWDKYLQVCNLPAAPRECFTQSQDDILVNEFKIEHKIEAQDPRNPTSICLATVVALQGPRILIRLDGGDTCNDFWRLIDAADIYPLGTHEAEGTLLQPPLGYTKNMSTWTSFLAKNREKGERAGKECFQDEPTPPKSNLFEIGMKLEAVDRKNPDLICPATIGDVKDDQILVSFDGWRGAMDYWCHYACRDLFPVGWCQDNEHPLTSPGNKGDSPAVVERLKLVADQLKRKTRSGAGSVQDIDKITTKIRPVTPPVLLKPDSKGVRGRMRSRPTRSLTPAAKMTEKADTPDTERDISVTTDKAVSVTVTESSGESETCDSSVSSHESSDSSSSDEDEVVEEGPKEEEEKDEESGNSDIDESVVEVKQPSPMERDESSSPERRDRNRRMKSKKAHKKHKRLSEYGLSRSTEFGKRKRYASAGDEDRYTVKIKDKKKNKRKHSGSSIYELPRKRMLGFGNQNSNVNTQQAQTADVQSPSFLDQGESPTSLFGFNRDEIVRKATEGWPSRLMGSSKMVVTSDNKLARFGQGNVDNACQISDSTTQEQSGQVERPNDDVSTTADVTKQDNEPESPNMQKLPDSTTPEKEEKISSQTVSSTTNPPPPSEQVETDPLKSEPSSPAAPLASPRRRSRNPQRWTVRDVMDYIAESEHALAPHVNLFAVHEIDGQALLLLNSSLAVKYMNMKLGPALKLAYMVEQLKEMVPPPRSTNSN